ncbi:carbohydrate kinase family protein [Candidatus Dependentiae bacterium]|nr:MAG: carbohydrate kinase family protein [Candidatus Dependentiae bacterium]
MKKVLTIGGATEDIFLLYKNIEMLHLATEFEKRSFIILEEGRKIEVDQLKYYTGGGATNSAVSFKRLGFDTTSFFKVGNNSEAVFILEELTKFGINLDYVVKDPEVTTAISFIIPTARCDRTVLVFRGANKFMREQEVPRKVFDQTDLVYITSLTGQSSNLLPVITELAKKQKCTVAVNPGTSQLQAGADKVREALSNIDIFTLNSREARYCMAALIQVDRELQRSLLDIEPFKAEDKLPELLRSTLVHKGICFSLRHYFKAILSRGPQIAVVTNGAEGVYVATEKEIIFHPSLPVSIVNTLGAGDAFSSCFVACLDAGMSLEDSLRSGILNATSVISYLDTKTGLLTKDQLKKQLAKLDTKLMQRFPL